jgi:hypothetical protein
VKLLDYYEKIRRQLTTPLYEYIGNLDIIYGPLRSWLRKDTGDEMHPKIMRTNSRTFNTLDGVFILVCNK